MVFSVFFLIGAMFCNDRIAATAGAMLSDAFKKKQDEGIWEKRFKYWSIAKYCCWAGAAITALFL